jgi:hypothetical protein
VGYGGGGQGVTEGGAEGAHGHVLGEDDVEEALLDHPRHELRVVCVCVCVCCSITPATNCAVPHAPAPHGLSGTPRGHRHTQRAGKGARGVQGAASPHATCREQPPPTQSAENSLPDPAPRGAQLPTQHGAAPLRYRGAARACAARPVPQAHTHKTRHRQKTGKGAGRGHETQDAHTHAICIVRHTQDTLCTKTRSSHTTRAAHDTAPSTGVQLRRARGQGGAADAGGDGGYTPGTLYTLDALDIAYTHCTHTAHTLYTLYTD